MTEAVPVPAPAPEPTAAPEPAPASGPASGAAPPAVAGVVLCGGASRRMGRDKALIGDPPWASRVAAALEAAGCEPVVLVGAPPDLSDPRPRLADDEPGAGPLAAVATAARALPGRDLLVAACDLPELDAGAVHPLLECLGRGAAAAVYLLDGREQWSLVAVAADQAVGVSRAVAGGASSMHGSLGPVAVRVAAVDDRRIRDVDEPPPPPGTGAGPDGR